MFARDCMTVNPVVVSPKTSVYEAMNIMKKNQFKRLPVVNNGKLVGIVTEADLMKISPSPATTLSIYEVNYLISKMTVADAMSKKVIVASPDDTVESVVLVMRDHDIGGLPIVEADNLVGIITESNIFDALIEMFGLRKTGSRITIHVSDKPGVIADITNLIRSLDINIISLATFNRSDDNAELVIRVDLTDPEKLVGKLTEKGYDITHVTPSF